jgi:hypothetical protein
LTCNQRGTLEQRDGGERQERRAGGKRKRRQTCANLGKNRFQSARAPFLLLTPCSITEKYLKE